MSLLRKIGNLLGLTQEMRLNIARKWRAFTRWTPPYYRNVSEWGLNTEPRDVKITLSLTSYPGRIKSVHRVITTLLNQTVKPDRVILWLGEEKFPRREEELPRRLLDLKQFGLTIGWCHDQRSYTKLLPALREYPDDIIVTVDDDSFYPPCLLATLYSGYLEFPGFIHALASMNIERGIDGELLSYNKWKHCTKAGRTGYDILLLGCGGVLYPPHVFNDEVGNENAFKRVAMTTDDLWFWAMAVYSGVKVRALGQGVGIQVGDPCANMANALWNTNVDEADGNNKKMRAILDAYPIVRERLYTELRSRGVVTEKLSGSGNSPLK